MAFPRDAAYPRLTSLSLLVSADIQRDTVLLRPQAHCSPGGRAGRAPDTFTYTPPATPIPTTAYLPVLLRVAAFHRDAVALRGQLRVLYGAYGPALQPAYHTPHFFNTTTWHAAFCCETYARCTRCCRLFTWWTWTTHLPTAGSSNLPQPFHLHYHPPHAATLRFLCLPRSYVPFAFITRLHTPATPHPAALPHLK